MYVRIYNPTTKFIEPIDCKVVRLTESFAELEIPEDFSKVFPKKNILSIHSGISKSGTERFFQILDAKQRGLLTTEEGFDRLVELIQKELAKKV